MREQILFGAAGAADGYLISLNLENGSRRWSRWLKEGCAYFGLRPESVLVGDYAKTFRELRLSDGALVQELATEGEIVGQIAVNGPWAYTIQWGDADRSIQLIKIEL